MKNVNEQSRGQADSPWALSPNICAAACQWRQSDMSLDLLLALLQPRMRCCTRAQIRVPDRRRLQPGCSGAGTGRVRWWALTTEESPTPSGWALFTVLPLSQNLDWRAAIGGGQITWRMFAASLGEKMPGQESEAQRNRWWFVQEQHCVKKRQLGWHSLQAFLWPFPLLLD